MFSPVRAVLVVLLLLLIAEHGQAQDPYYTVLNKANGLPSNAVYDIFQDSRGFIWIAGDGGLSRYDGYEFKTYTSSSQTFRPGNGIEEDKYGRIWYKNFDGYLYFVEGDSLRGLQQRPTFGNAAYAIIGGRLLVKWKDGVDIFDLVSLKVVKTIKFDNANSVGELHYKDKYYSIQTDRIVAFSADGTMEQTPIDVPGLPGASANGVIVINRHRTDPACFELRTGKPVRRALAPAVKYIQGVIYSGGIHWVLTPNGVWAYDSAWNAYNNGMPYFKSKNTSCVMRDREGNCWLGTLDDGILFVPNLAARLLTAPDFAPDVFANAGNRLLAGTRNNSLYEYTGKEFVQVFSERVRHEVYCLVAHKATGTIIVSSKDFLLTDEKFRVRKREPHAVKDVAVLDDKYCAYAGTGLSGIVRMADTGTSVWDSLYEANKSPVRSGFCEFPDARNRGRTLAYDAASATVYLGSGQGIKKITPYSAEDVLNNGQPVYARKLIVYRGVLYILTQQNQLYMRGSDGKVRPVTPLQDNEEILGVRHTGGSLYVYTNVGIRHLDTVTGRFMPVNLRIGVSSAEINDIADVDGSLFIATDRGVIATNKTDTGSNRVPPGFIINSLLVNGRRPGPVEMARLSHRQNDIEIRYSILAFSTSDRYRLQYSINGHGWQYASQAVRLLKLASLAPGAYTIDFRLCDERGHYYAQPPVVFTILRPFWLQWWFWAACFAFAAACGYAYYRWQTGMLKQQNALTIEKMELEKNLRNSMLTSIRAQMNPHFFYNALNTIQSFIFSDDKRNASTYLVKMSRLTRMILEMSGKEAITLDEEIEALRLYLELEKIRFGNEFNYSINIAAGVDTEMMKIPSMIVQPYVENAVKHGLLHRQGRKDLAIDFSRTNGTLCITIQDNGIGRQRAAEMRQAKKEMHQSFATGANSKRIELLNRERAKDIGVLYKDNKDGNGIPTGTTVIISIPLI